MKAYFKTSLQNVALVILIGSYLIAGANPIKDFCIRNGIKQKSVIISLSLADCAVCYTPPQNLLGDIRSNNENIPVYVVTDEDMAEGERIIFKNKFGTHANSLTFITDKPTYFYMLSEKSGIPGVCCVSDSGEVLVFKHLKHENLDELFKEIKSDFSVALVRKLELKNNFISPKKHNGFIVIRNNLYLFHPGVNAIAKYTEDGKNCANLFIDSLNIDYLQLAKRLFPNKVYFSSKEDYEKQHSNRGHLIRAINVIKMGDTICALMQITAVGDTIFNDRPMKYERGYACMFMFDADLKYLSTTFFSSSYESSIMNFYMRGAYLNKKFFLGRYDSLLKKDVIAEYFIKNANLDYRQQFQLPVNEDFKNKMPIAPAICTSRNNIYTSCFKTNDKGLITAVRTFKLDPMAQQLKMVVNTDVYWPQMYSTEKGNFILLTIDKDFKNIVKAYDFNSKQLINVKDTSDKELRIKDSIYFVIDGHLEEYAYSE